MDNKYMHTNKKKFKKRSADLNGDWISLADSNNTTYTIYKNSSLKSIMA